MPKINHMILLLLTAIFSAMGIYLLALATGTDFSRVAAPPALLTPLPWWLFALYSVGGAAAMFPLFVVSLRLSRPKMAAVSGIAAGLALMTPAPFIVTQDFATIFWLSASHVALVSPLFFLALSLPSRNSKLVTPAKQDTALDKN